MRPIANHLRYSSLTGPTLCLLGAFLFLFSACGLNIQLKEKGQEDLTEAKQQRFKVNFKTFFFSMDQPEISLNLEGVTKLSGKIVGCSSGESPSFNEQTTTLQLRRFDTSCAAIVESFTLGSVFFEPEGTFDPKVGANNYFKGSDGSTGKVILLSQLSPKIGSQEEIDINLVQLKRQSVSTKLGQPQTIVGVRADRTEAEEGENSVFFTFFKVVEKDSSALNINYKIRSDLRTPEDYLTPTNSFVSLPASTQSQKLEIRLVDDSAMEAEKSITIVPTAGIGYAFFGSATTKIIDDDVTRSDLFDFNANNADWSDTLSPSTQGEALGAWIDPEKTDLVLRSNDNSDSKPPIVSKIGSQNAVDFSGNTKAKLCSSPVGISKLTSHSKLSLTIVFKTRGARGDSGAGSALYPKQSLFNLANDKNGINVYIQDNFLYFTAHSMNTGSRDFTWGPEFRIDRVEGSLTYVATFIFDQPGGRMEIYLNSRALSSTSGMIGKIKNDPFSIGVGGLCDGGIWHDQTTAQDSRSFNGSIARVLLEKGTLEPIEVQMLHDKLFEEYDMPKKPTDEATAAAFTDTDPQTGEIGGRLTIEKAADEAGFTDYVVYWGLNGLPVCVHSSTDPIGCGRQIAKTGSNLGLSIPTDTKIPEPTFLFPANQLHIHTRNLGIDSATPVIINLTDL